MRILMANNYHYVRGGAERVMFEEMRLLKHAGHEVACFSAKHLSNTPSPLDEFFPAVNAEGRTLLQRLREAPRFVANPVVRVQFGRALDAFRPDVVHFHNIYGRLTPVVAQVAGERGVPSVMTAHDNKLVCASYLRLDNGRPCGACSYGKYYPAFFHACHKGSRVTSALYGIESYLNFAGGRYDAIGAFICPSRFFRESFAAKGVPGERLRWLPNCVDVAPDDLAAHERNHVLFVGRLSVEKGLASLLRAMRQVNAPLVVAGDGPEAKRLRELADALGIGERVRFLGHCSTVTLSELYETAAVSVVPSECYENAPMAVLEAFAHGTPVVGANVGGIPELIVEGTNGLMFKPGDDAALAQALCALLDDPVRLAAMGRAARSAAAERFNAKVHLRGLLAIYREVLG